MNPKYYLVSKKGKTLSACIDYVKRRSVANDRILKYAISVGGKHAGYSTFDGQLMGVYFEGEQPKGWRKKDKDGYSRPKKKSEYYDTFSNIEGMPCPYQFSAELTGAPSWISCEAKGGSWGTSTSEEGHWHHTVMLWMSKDGPFLLKVPDINGYIESNRRGRKTFKSTPESWELSLTGVREILYEEWLLMVAKNKQKKAA